MKILRSITLCVLVFSLVSCATKPKQDKPLPKTGVITVVKAVEVEDEAGGISVEAQLREELAERSTIDKGAESLVTAQKIVSVGPFSHYDIGQNDQIVASVFNQQGKLGSDIWVYSGGRTRVTNTTYFNDTPSFSKDDNFIYFATTRGRKSRNDQNSYIWRMPTRGGGGITRIGSGLYEYKLPLESPDGRFILYSAREFYENSPFIWYSHTNGALPTQLTKGIHAQWNGNSSVIYAVQDDNTGLYTIWTLNINGSDRTQIISDPNLDCWFPTPQPNGLYIAYVKQEPKKESTSDIYLYNIETGLSQQITTNISRDDLPRWSNDGKSLYFRSTRGLNWSIWRVPC